MDEHDKLQLSSRQPTDRATQATLHAGQPRQVPTTARSRRIDIRTPTLQGKHQARRDRPSCNQPRRWRHQRERPCRLQPTDSSSTRPTKLQPTDTLATSVPTMQGKHQARRDRPCRLQPTDTLATSVPTMQGKHQARRDRPCRLQPTDSSSTRPTKLQPTDTLATSVPCMASIKLDATDHAGCNQPTRWRHRLHMPSHSSSNAIGLYISRIYQPWVPGHTVLDARTYVITYNIV